MKLLDQFNRKIDYFVDAKGIHPKANYKPQFKRRPVETRIS